MKLLILGHADHGKDTVAEIIRRLYGLSFSSSSWFALERCIWPAIGDQFNSIEHCFDQRDHHRDEWRKLIREYNGDDPARLIRELLEDNDMYVGLRHHEEFETGRDLFDHVIWVHAFDRCGSEPTMTIEVEDSFITIDNNGDQIDTLLEIEKKLAFLEND